MHKGLQGRYRVPDTVRDIINLIIWVVFGVIGGILLALSLARRQKSAEAVTADMVVPNGRSARTKPLPALR